MSQVSNSPFQDKEAQTFMNHAHQLAQKAQSHGEVPIGALIVHEGEIIAEGFNQKESQHNPLLHAEVLALQKASQKLQRWRLTDCHMFVSLEPCLMCCGALISARIDSLYYATPDPKAGAVHSLYQTLDDTRLNHQVTVHAGFLQEECAKLLKNFFQAKRTKGR